jgi:hypothetical protein
VQASSKGFPQGQFVPGEIPLWIDLWSRDPIQERKAMHPRYWQHCASLNAKGKPCGNNGNCPAHREANRERHRADDESRMAEVRRSVEQLTLIPKLSREDRERLIREGYEAEAKKAVGSAPCGCQG